jgi:hypothetical protein
MKPFRQRSKSLLALSSTALAIPGIASGDAPPPQTTLSYKFSNYNEDDMSRSQVPFGSLERYDIDVHQFRLLTPVGRDYSLQIDANHENMSGASPWFTTAGTNGSPIINMSGASGITDERSELAVGVRYYLSDGSIGGAVGYSEENDYRATYFSFSGQKTINEGMTTVSVGISHSADDIFPTDAAIFNRVRNADKQSSSAVISISQIINQRSTFQLAGSLTEQSGFLSDPYKFRDVRPDNKTQLALSGAYRYFVVNADAALHTDYRYYHDDFGVSSHTLSVAWHQNLGNRWQLVPNLRYYSQSAADFYTNIDDFLKPLTEFQSSDYRLSAYGAFSGGASVVASINDWTATLTAERYVADHKHSAYAVTQPGAALVSYTRVSLGFDFTF